MKFLREKSNYGGNKISTDIKKRRRLCKKCRCEYADSSYDSDTSS